MKTIAFVPVRLTSSRLPEKHLKLIGDRTLLSWVVKRLKSCKEIDEIVICTPEEKENDKLISFCKEEDVRLYIYNGSVNDVVGRLASAARQFGADICVLGSGDCPLLCSKTIDKLVSLLKSNPDYSIACLKQSKKPLIHEGIGVVKREVWELADKLSDTPQLRENHFPVLKTKKDRFKRFKTICIEDDEIFYRLNHRISVDTPMDLEFMNAVYQELKSIGKEFNLINTIELLEKKPQLMEINKNVKQKDLNDKSYNILMVVSAVSNYGYGNLMRSLEIGRVLTQKGFGVRFAVFDEEALNLCKKNLFGCFVINNLDNVKNISKEFDAVIFDLNSQIFVNKSLVLSLKQQSKVVVFIDNLSEGAKISDLIIIPTAHYIGEKLKNLVWGEEHVVLRKKVLDSRPKPIDEKKGVIARIDKDKMEIIKNLWKNVEFIEDFDENFVEKVNNAATVILHLGISCYEAVYLNTPIVVIPRRKDEVMEIEKFNLFCISDSRKKLGNGAEKIVEQIVKLIN
ncbi:cytidylyltransferase domain-containing protein [Hippea jasoniae]|uniref:cytidylyltransferase domain-containing protein n=1 Tax=Hippea jasoniae TaxID=944479 RepID=UPI000553247A|nr:NTP transferase domain-containing protein [Hippea jasoniae]